MTAAEKAAALAMASMSTPANDDACEHARYDCTHGTLTRTVAGGVTPCGIYVGSEQNGRSSPRISERPTCPFCRSGTKLPWPWGSRDAQREDDHALLARAIAARGVR